MCVCLNICFLMIYHCFEIKKLCIHSSSNPAVFHLLDENEDYGLYEHTQNENNWDVFYKTLSPVSDFNMLKII